MKTKTKRLWDYLVKVIGEKDNIKARKIFDYLAKLEGGIIEDFINKYPEVYVFTTRAEVNEVTDEIASFINEQLLIPKLK